MKRFTLLKMFSITALMIATAFLAIAAVKGGPAESGKFRLVSDPLAEAVEDILLPLTGGVAAESSLERLTAGAQRLSASGGPVKLAWFYKPPNGGEIDRLVESFDTYILTRNDEAVRDRLAEAGVDGPFLQYLRFDAIMDPGSCSATPWQNQAANRPGDFCDISNNHPDWFLLDQNGSRIHVGNGFYMMDPGSPGWQTFFLERARESQEQYGWDGVFLDNVDASLKRFTRRGGSLQKYPDNAAYQAAVEGFLKTLFEGYFFPTHRPLAANIIYLEEPDVWFRYLTYLDGAMEESWAFEWHIDHLSTAEWEAQLDRAEQTQDMGRFIYLISQGERESWKRQRFAYGSYLLVTHGLAAFRYSNPDHYADLWMYESYNFRPGEPVGERYLYYGKWRRDFARGYVLVDPEEHEAWFYYASPGKRYPEMP